MEPFSDDWDILSGVYKMLLEQNVLQTPANEPVVRFEHPADLKVIYICRAKYSVCKLRGVSRTY